MKNNKGITLLSLVITIIVLLILISITIASSLNLDVVEDDIIRSELTIVQNAILQRYTKYTLTKNEDILVGSTVTGLTTFDWNSLGIVDSSAYKQLSASDLANLGISNYKQNYVYVVNYQNGDVIIKTADGTLYNL